MLAASLELADEQDLPAVTMQAVADRLGVTSMALYRHVANKADLLDGLVERILWEVPLPDPSEPWPDRLAAPGGRTRRGTPPPPGLSAAPAAAGGDSGGPTDP